MESQRHNHSCSNSVPLHVVEEMWAIASEEEMEKNEQKEEQSDKESEEVVLAMSIATVSGGENNKTIRPWASIHCQQFLVLVDSGSSVSFMSAHLMEMVKGVQTMCRGP